MPRNRTSSDSMPILKDSDSFDSNSDHKSSSIESTDLNSLKQLFLQRAWDCWNNQQNEPSAIFYQTVSFCLQSKCASQANDDLCSYIEKLKLEVTYPTSGLNYSQHDNINKYLEREIINTCRHQFPKEWTIIQLCKNYNPVALSSKHDDIANYNTSIFMTVFKHSAVKDMMMIEIKKLSQNLFEKIYKVNKMITESLNYSKMPQETEIEKQESRRKYWTASKEIEQYLNDAVNLLKTFIGPWMCALTGNFKNRKSIEMENEIRKKVYEFLKTRNFSEHQQKLIHLLARRTDLLTNQQIFLAITYILRDKPNLGYSDIDLNDIYDHLTWIKQEYVYDDVTTYPVILIVDELLDQMPFEMVNTNQEFTRVCSFANLKSLFERYCGSIENGYLMCPTTNGQVILNPEGNLSVMEDRMKDFFNYWLPSWSLTSNQNPSKEEFNEILTGSDVMAYCGHGSGLQNFSINNLYNLKTRAIVFLFGCGSVSLTSSGLNSEMKGAHIYYHIGWCPAVVGFLWTVTDYNTDLCATKILSSWCNRVQPKAHWQCLDKATWKNHGSLVFNKVGDILSSDSLSETITRVKAHEIDLPISIRAALVHRGLPAINSSK